MELNQVTKSNIITMSKWMKFLGIINIVMGALLCLTCIYAIIGWIPILLGVWMQNSAKNFGLYADQNNEQAFDQAINKLKNVYQLSGIITIIYLALVAIGLVIGIIMLITGAFSGFHGFKGLLNN